MHRSIGDPKDFALVFFSSARAGWGKKWFHSLLMALCRFISGSELVHVCIGYDQAVFDYRATGPVYWAMRFMTKYPNLVAVVKVPVRTELNLAFWEGLVGKPVDKLGVFRRYLQRGRGEMALDCLCTTMISLKDCGVICPDTIHTPKQLFDWLTKEKKYEYIRESQRHTLAHWTFSDVS